MLRAHVRPEEPQEIREAIQALYDDVDNEMDTMDPQEHVASDSDLEIPLNEDDANDEDVMADLRHEIEGLQLDDGLVFFLPLRSTSNFSQSHHPSSGSSVISQ
jgi:hypothetical protein